MNVLVSDATAKGVPGPTGRASRPTVSAAGHARSSGCRRAGGPRRRPLAPSGGCASARGATAGARRGCGSTAGGSAAARRRGSRPTTALGATSRRTARRARAARARRASMHGAGEDSGYGRDAAVGPGRMMTIRLWHPEAKACSEEASCRVPVSISSGKRSSRRSARSSPAARLSRYGPDDGSFPAKVRHLEEAVAEMAGTRYALALNSGHERPARGPRGAGHRPGRRGHRARLHVRRLDQRHRLLRAPRRSLRRSTAASTSIPPTSRRASRPGPGPSCSSTCWATLAGCPRSGPSPSGIAWRSSRTRPRPSEPRTAVAGWATHGQHGHVQLQRVQDHHLRRRRHGRHRRRAPLPRAFAMHDQGHSPGRAGRGGRRAPVPGPQLPHDRARGRRPRSPRSAGWRPSASTSPPTPRSCAPSSRRCRRSSSGSCPTPRATWRRTSWSSSRAQRMAERVTAELGSITLDRSGWHVYSHMEHLLARRTATERGYPFDEAGYADAPEYRVGMLPATDALLARSMSFSIGVHGPQPGSVRGPHASTTPRSLPSEPGASARSPCATRIEPLGAVGRARGAAILALPGEVAEWLKATVLKTVERKLRGFESHPLRQPLHA